MSNLQHTLFLWPRGAFPRRIVYQLLISNFTPSPTAILAGETTIPSLTLNNATLVFNSTGAAMVDAHPSDPKPADKSSPALRIRDTDTNEERWIHESTSVMLYLDDGFNQGKMLGPTSVDRGQAFDMIELCNLLFADVGYQVRHDRPGTTMWSLLEYKDHSLPAAANAKSHADKKLVKIQSWAEKSLDKTGWMTPGVDGPGLVDAAFAALVRYLALCYEINLLKDEKLGKLRAWFEKFQTLDWWKGLEEEGDVHPPQLKFLKPQE